MTDLVSDSYDRRLAKDLERMARYAAMSKSINLDADTLKKIAEALDGASDTLADARPLETDLRNKVLDLINTLAPQIAPATAGSLLLSSVTDNSLGPFTAQEIAIRDNLNGTKRTWMIFTVLVFFAILIATVFLPAACIDGKLQAAPDLSHLISIGYLAFVGLLGSSCFILRNMLNKLSDQTLILRDSYTYWLRAILGTVLGYIIPSLVLSSSSASALTSNAFLVAFLAGYGVEPMFSALDNLVASLRDFVTRTPQSGTK